jgi:xanthine/uracil permease
MIIGSLFSSFPYTTFSENSGLVALSGIKSRFVLVAAGLILILLSVFQKVAFIIASIPNPVLGGASVIMFGLIAVIGIKTLAKIDFSKPENLLIPSVSIGLGVGVSAVPEIFKHFPESWRILFANGIVVGSLMAVLIYLFFHKWNSSSDTKG